MDLIRIDPVYVYETTNDEDDNVKFSGSLFLKEKPPGVFMEWTHDDQSVSSFDPKNNLRHNKFLINFNIQDLKSIREASSDTASFTQVTFILKCGTTHTNLHMNSHQYHKLIKLLKTHLTLTESTQKEGLFIVTELKKFDMNLFDAEPLDTINKFMSFTLLTKVGKFVQDVGKEVRHNFEVSLYNDKDNDPDEVNNTNIKKNSKAEESAQGVCVVGDCKNLEVVTLNYDNGSEFEFISHPMKTGDLPARPHVTRGSPIQACDWTRQFDTDGKIINPATVKQHIFRNGVDKSIRQEVWKFLLGYHSWTSTAASRINHCIRKADEYAVMKQQWVSMTDDQISRFTDFKVYKSLTEKDVKRTDRTHPFYKGRNNPNLFSLNNILLTHCMYHFDLGYVQGMSDLLAPILVIMDNEVDAFWSFAGFIRLLSHNFEMSQQSMKNQMSQLQVLIKFLDPELTSYLDKNDSLNMYFCFRWLLIVFKREFNYSDIMKLWEVLWTGLPCQNFHLLLALSILETSKDEIIENRFGFTEILKLMNDKTGNIDVDKLLCIAEGMFIQLSTCPSLPHTIKRILGLDEFFDLKNNLPFNSFDPFDETFENIPYNVSSTRVTSPVSASSHSSSPLSHSSDKSFVPENCVNVSSKPHNETKTKSDSSNIEIINPFS